MEFMNKVVLITGAARGLGATIAREFAKRKANIILNYNTSEIKAQTLKKELEDNYNVEVLTVKADISNEEEVKNMIEKSIEKFGKIDCLVNNAAIAIDTTFEDKTKANFMKILEVNLVGTSLVSKYVGDTMKERKSGSIINISSTNGIDTEYVESLDYDASKAGVISLTKNLAKYYSPEIRVNCIAPGWINTEMNENLSEKFRKDEESKILLNRFAEPEEIAKVVVFLASEDASYINSTIIRVDGGVR